MKNLELQKRANDVRRLVVPIDNLLTEARNAHDVFIGLGRQADHEIELHLRPTVVERDLHGAFELFFRDVFVDDVTHALRAGFRRERLNQKRLHPIQVLP